MENSKPLATESFSYSWLVDETPRSYDNENENENDRNFDFDVPFTSSSHLSLVDADEIFSNGLIMPIYVHRTLKTSNSAPQSPVSSSYNYLAREIVSNKKRCFGMKKCRRILQKWFGLVKPLYHTIGCTRKSSRVDDLERKVCEVRSLSNSVEVSPRPSSVGGTSCKKVKSWRCSPQNSSTRVSPARPSNAWCVDESSIHEAILYCKRSIEN